jgi:hypothetical protein
MNMHRGRLSVAIAAYDANFFAFLCVVCIGIAFLLDLRPDFSSPEYFSYVARIDVGVRRFCVTMSSILYPDTE